jgi:hypothetical protein
MATVVVYCGVKLAKRLRPVWYGSWWLLVPLSIIVALQCWYSVLQWWHWSGPELRETAPYYSSRDQHTSLDNNSDHDSNVLMAYLEQRNINTEEWRTT